MRHAFGSYLDVMREVAYSPMMAGYLTFLLNKAQFYTGSYPDENFAREIMQLFSIGLWRLNPDGTRALDSGASGAPVPAYTNLDIVSFARVWTGFVAPSIRGNIEQKRISPTGPPVDPMSIEADKRDLLPKMDLWQGHLGDGYPLCTDLAPRAFGQQYSRGTCNAERVTSNV